MAFSDTEEFKRCTCCGQVWPAREDFLSDDNILLNGYQANFKDPARGLFLFVHLKKECGTSVAIRSENFRDLYDGPVYLGSLRGSEECPGYCLGQFDLNRCDARCRNAYVRELLHIIGRWPKK